MAVSDQAKRLREILRLLERQMGLLDRDEASCCGITLSQCHTLVEVGRAEEMSVNVLAEILRLDKSTVSRTVDKLVNDGMIVRQVDPDDRRYAVLRLSGPGRSVFEELERRMAAYFEEVAAAIPAAKREQVIGSLQYLVRALENHRCC